VPATIFVAAMESRTAPADSASAATITQTRNPGGRQAAGNLVVGIVPSLGQRLRISAEHLEPDI
jgi:hypothetical protein